MSILVIGILLFLFVLILCKIYSAGYHLHFIRWIRSIINPTIYYFVEDNSKIHANADSSFGAQVMQIINRSDYKKKFRIERTFDKHIADINIYLVDRTELDKYHRDALLTYYPGSNKQIRYSVTIQDINHKPVVLIDDINWYKGVEESKLNISEYQQYVILHEFGHALGLDHQKCDTESAPTGVCPVLWQSTIGCPDGFKCGYQVTEQDYTKKIDGRYIELEHYKKF